MSNARPDKLYYTGSGFYVGVPARDLEAGDIAALDDDQLGNVIASESYRKTKPKAASSDQEAEPTTTSAAAEKKLIVPETKAADVETRSAAHDKKA